MHLINAQVTDEVDQPKDVQSIADKKDSRYYFTYSIFKQDTN